MASDEHRRRDHPPLNTPLCDVACDGGPVLQLFPKTASTFLALKPTPHARPAANTVCALIFAGFNVHRIYGLAAIR